MYNLFIALGASVLWVVVYRTAWAALVTLVLGALATAWVRRRARAAARDGSSDERDGTPGGR